MQSDLHSFEASRKIFETIDEDHSGLLTKQELTAALLKNQNSGQDLGLTIGDIVQIVEKLGFDNKDRIGYSEWLAGTLSIKSMTEASMLQLFQELDPENFYYLTSQSFKKCF